MESGNWGVGGGIGDWEVEEFGPGLWTLDFGLWIFDFERNL